MRHLAQRVQHCARHHLPGGEEGQRWDGGTVTFLSYKAVFDWTNGRMNQSLFAILSGQLFLMSISTNSHSPCMPPPPQLPRGEFYTFPSFSAPGAPASGQAGRITVWRGRARRSRRQGQRDKSADLGPTAVSRVKSFATACPPQGGSFPGLSLKRHRWRLRQQPRFWTRVGVSGVIVNGKKLRYGASCG